MASLLAHAAETTEPSLPKFVVPNFKDLTIKQRTTMGLSQPSVATSFFKGARARSEHNPENSRITPPFSVIIEQCDLKTRYMLNEREKTYRKSSWGDRQGHPLSHKPNTTGPEVIITVDTEDTGERRQMSSFEARRVRTTITVEPSKDAETKPGKAVVDGWYIDLVGVGCLQRDPESLGAELALMLFHTGGRHDHVIIKRIGNGQRGYAVEETATIKEEHNVVVRKRELLEFSDQPLNPSLFELPPDYSPAPMPKMDQPGQKRDPFDR